MKSKLENSIAELHKLKNQIRVQLNQIRPRHSPIILQKKERSTKKIYLNKYQPTDILQPSAQKSQEMARDKKRYYDTSNILYTETNRSTQKKHFGQYYSDNVILTNPIRRKTSSYFNIRKNNTTPSPNKHQSTSLIGIGVNDKSNTLHSYRSCIRVYHNRQSQVL